jgi:hypothetical protein
MLIENVWMNNREYGMFHTPSGQSLHGLGRRHSLAALGTSLGMRPRRHTFPHLFHPSIGFEQQNG